MKCSKKHWWYGCTLHNSFKLRFPSIIIPQYLAVYILLILKHTNSWYIMFPVSQGTGKKGQNFYYIFCLSWSEMCRKNPPLPWNVWTKMFFIMAPTLEVQIFVTHFFYTFKKKFNLSILHSLMCWNGWD